MHSQTHTHADDRACKERRQGKCHITGERERDGKMIGVELCMFVFVPTIIYAMISANLVKSLECGFAEYMGGSYTCSCHFEVIHSFPGTGRRNAAGIR